MTVKELIEILEDMPEDAEVFYLDTWWRVEGYGENVEEEAWNEVDTVSYNEEKRVVEIGEIYESDND